MRVTSGEPSGRDAVGTGRLDSSVRLPMLVQGRVRGARHVREGKPCQDAIRARRSDDVVALALADGHGTSARGDVGAALAVDVATAKLIEFADKLGRGSPPERVQAFAEHPLRVHIVREWVERVRGHAGAHLTDLQPYGTTLLFALASPEYLLVGQLGDGDILVVDERGRVSRPIAPDPNCFGDDTASLCQQEASFALRVRADPPPRGELLLLLSTDGYSKSYSTDEIFEAIGPDYLDLMRELGAEAVEKQLPEILEQVSRGGSGDDISLGMLYWPRATGDGAAARLVRTSESSDFDRAPESVGDRSPGNTELLTRKGG
ncbi:MAG: PP2C family serine/threonine-protein phosphatase [Myxococcales bacterium]|nr:PP2C family serine/threonine-protein phosphatase [Myxococcales bacterium]